VEKIMILEIVLIRLDCMIIFFKDLLNPT